MDSIDDCCMFMYGEVEMLCFVCGHGGIAGKRYGQRVTEGVGWATRARIQECGRGVQGYDARCEYSFTGFTITSTTYVSNKYGITSYCAFETCNCLFASSEILKCRLLKQLLDHPMRYMRNLLGWLETRLAQNTLNYLQIA